MFYTHSCWVFTVFTQWNGNYNPHFTHYGMETHQGEVTCPLTAKCRFKHKCSDWKLCMLHWDTACLKGVELRVTIRTPNCSYLRVSEVFSLPLPRFQCWCEKKKFQSNVVLFYSTLKHYTLGKGVMKIYIYLWFPLTISNRVFSNFPNFFRSTSGFLQFQSHFTFQVSVIPQGFLDLQAVWQCYNMEVEWLFPFVHYVRWVKSPEAFLKVSWIWFEFVVPRMARFSTFQSI